MILRNHNCFIAIFYSQILNFNWNFPIQWSAITSFRILRELDRRENYVKDPLVRKAQAQT